MLFNPKANRKSMWIDEKVYQKYVTWSKVDQQVCFVK